MLTVFGEGIKWVGEFPGYDVKSELSVTITFDVNDETISEQMFIDVMSGPIVSDVLKNDTSALYVVASGSYLKLIRELFSNIPMTKHDSVTWSGEMAKFILLNLQVYANALKL